MLIGYPAVFSDANGEESTFLENDGKMLCLTVRGVTFTGTSPDDLRPTIPLGDPLLAHFTLEYYSPEIATLSFHSLTYEVPVMVVMAPEEMVAARLHVSVATGDPVSADYYRGYPLIRLTLNLWGEIYKSGGVSGWFEDELLDIQRALPEGMYMKTCINCAFSDYSVYGHSVFGDMMCFRGNKEEYLSVRTKREYMAMRCGATELIQETYLCPEFARRVPGTGYRG